MPQNNERGRTGETATSLPVVLRVVVAFTLPLAGGLTAVALGTGLAPTGATDSRAIKVLLLGPMGIISWLLGLRWYGLPGMGLRGRRPLFAAIGFAVLGWVAFLLFRFLFVRIHGFGQSDSTRTFIFLLLFESFAVQIWTFGLLFRAFSDWRGPLTAAVGSGITFGTLGQLLFQEAFVSSVSSYLFFVLWGVLYGVIRLRTGSLLGIVLVQSLQSFTAWIVLTPFLQPEEAQLQTLYVVAGLAYVAIIWRLWPKREEDYRV